MKENKSDRLFRIVVTLFLILVALFAVIPLLSTVALSLSSSNAVNRNAVTLWPVDFTFASWQYILRDLTLWRSCLITAVSTILTVVLSILVTALMAYPLSKPFLRGGRVLMVAVILTMIFKAPVVPYFLTLRTLGMYNNPIVLVLPHLFSAFNMAILRTSFKAFPAEIEEAAVIDGCGYGRVLFRVILPSQKATLTTIGLFYGVVAWNQFQHPLMFISDVRWYPLQMRIRQVINGGSEVMLTVLKSNNLYNETTLGAATMLFAILPVIAVYPWLQKYFTKGAMLGSVKG
ncbi:MAG: carbohydrate ABC transporter permease [Clostridia bacterium]|nr:carbohydrate ABC transporter permease [Clostridia bacterium]